MALWFVSAKPETARSVGLTSGRRQADAPRAVTVPNMASTHLPDNLPPRWPAEIWISPRAPSRHRAAAQGRLGGIPRVWPRSPPRVWREGRGAPGSVWVRPGGGTRPLDNAFYTSKDTRPLTYAKSFPRWIHRRGHVPDGKGVVVVALCPRCRPRVDPVSGYPSSRWTRADPGTTRSGSN